MESFLLDASKELLSKQDKARPGGEEGKIRDITDNMDDTGDNIYNGPARSVDMKQGTCMNPFSPTAAGEAFSGARTLDSRRYQVNGAKALVVC